MKLGDLLHDYAETKLRLRLIRENTALNYHSSAARFPAWLTTKDVKKVTPSDIEKACAEMLHNGLAASSIRVAHALLAGAMDRAVRDGLVVLNTARLVKPPGNAPRTNPKAITDEDVKRLLAVATLEPLHWGLLIRIAIGTGMRRGEICALRWKDVNWPRQELTVARAAVENGKYLREGPPKSAAGLRTVVMPKSLYKELWSLHARRQPKPDDYILGRWMRPTAASRAVSRIMAKAGVHHAKLHSLRHTHATALVSAGEPLPAIARRLGHSTVSTTMSIYAHPKDGEDKALASRIERLVS